MNLQKFTIKAQEAVQRALEIAAAANHQGLEAPHLLKAFLEEENGVVPAILNQLNVPISSLEGHIDDALAKLPVVSGASVSGQYVGTDMKKTFDKAADEAKKLSDEFVATEHLLLALAQSKGSTGDALKDLGVTAVELMPVYPAKHLPKGKGRRAFNSPCRSVAV